MAGAAGAAAFFAGRRLAFFALRAGFRVAFFATFRLAVFFFALRPAFFAVLRAGFLAAALRTVVRFFAAFLRAGFLFAVIGIETTPFRDRPVRHAPTKNVEKYAEVVLTKQYQGLSPKYAVNRKNEKPSILLCFRASSGYGRKSAGRA
jgi:hypothetical protein